MLNPVRMQKVRIIALKSVLSLLIKKLHELGLVEISVSNYEKLEKGRPLDYFDQVSKELVRIRAIKGMLENKEVKVEPKIIENPLEEAQTVTLDQTLKIIGERKEKANQELAQCKEELKKLQLFSGFNDIDFSKLETKTLTYLFGIIATNKEKLVRLRSELEAKVKTYSIATSESGGQTLVLIIYPRAQPIDEIVSLVGLSRVEVPKTLGMVYHTIERLRKSIAEKQREIIECNNEILIISKKHYAHIASLEYTLSIEADRAEIASRFNFTVAAAIIEGWAKQEDLQKLEHAIAQLENKAALEKIEASHHEMPPIVLQNPDIASPFQFITERYSLPNYYEIDPSIIFLITIPLLYGMIVGDVIYGIISVFIALFFMRKFPKSYIMKNVSKLWLYSSIPSVLFGLLFDEWAGFNHFHLLEILEKWGIIDLASFGIHGPLYDFHLSRAHNLPAVIGLSLIIGLLHLALGFILGAINEWHHSKKHALAKIAWLGVEIGGTLVVTTFMFGMFPENVGQLGGGLLGVSVIGLIFTEGVMGILELPGFAGNVLSYARIAAIGVVGVILAEIINEFLIPLPQQGIIALILLPLFLILHAANTFIAMFEALIQGGRLNIIEFKLKFMKGGGKLFKPFALHSK